MIAQTYFILDTYVNSGRGAQAPRAPEEAAKRGCGVLRHRDYSAESGLDGSGRCRPNASSQATRRRRAIPPPPCVTSASPASCNFGHARRVTLSEFLVSASHAAVYATIAGHLEILSNVVDRIFEGGDAGLAAQRFDHDPDLLLSRVPLPRDPPERPDSGFRSLLLLGHSAPVSLY